MLVCGLHPSLNKSGNGTLHQDVNTARNIAEDFLYLNTDNTETHIIGGFCVLTSVFGMVGNGLVLWFLCFCLKENTFVFITNLAVADFGLLFIIFIYFSQFFVVDLYGHSHNAVCVTNLCLVCISFVFFSASASFLAAVSAERCVAVFLPLWHRCHRPKSLPAVVSALLWTSASLTAVLIFYCEVWLGVDIVGIILVFLFDSFMVLSILPLLIRLCTHSYPWQKGRLLKATLLALSVFIITMLPQNFLRLFIQDTYRAYLLMQLLASLNSSANPVIYFLIGRLRSGPSRRSVKVVLKKLFNEDEEYEPQPSSSKTSVQTT